MGSHRGLKLATRRAIATELRSLVERSLCDEESDADNLAYLTHGVLDVAQRVYAVEGGGSRG